MPEKILGLDIGDESIKAVQVTAGLKGYQFLKSVHIRLDEAGGIEGALDKLFEDDEMRSGIYIVSLPAGKVSLHTMTLPFKDRKKIRQTISYELEPLIPRPIDEVVADFIVIEQKDTSEILAAAAPKEEVAALCRLLEERHAEASVIDLACVPVATRLLADYAIEESVLVLDIGESEATGVFCDDGKILQIRSFPTRPSTSAERVLWISSKDKEPLSIFENFLREVKNTLKFLQMKGKMTSGPSKIFLTGDWALFSPLREEMERFFSIPVEVADIAAAGNVDLDDNAKENWNPALMNQALALAVRETKKGDGFNFATGEFEPKRQYEKAKKEILWVASLLFVIILAFGFDFYLDYHYDKRYANELKEEIRAVFSETCPEVTRIVDPLQQLRVKIAEGKKSKAGQGSIGTGITVLDILRETSSLVPESAQFLITSFQYDGNLVTIKGETDNFNTVDTIKNHLAGSKMFKNVTISSAALVKKESRVGFNLRMELI
jgi:general secretion pathway protein L